MRGPADAKITLVEYGDYECRRCGQAYRILQQVLEEVGEDVRFVFRNFPSAEAHPDAAAAAEAAESVAVQGGEDAFWAMHDLLHESQDALQHDDLMGMPPRPERIPLRLRTTSRRTRGAIAFAATSIRRGAAASPEHRPSSSMASASTGMDRPISAGRRAPRWHTRSHVHDTLSPGGWRFASRGWLRAR